MIIELLTNEQLEVIYLDWFNNFLTLEIFSDHYGILQSTANDIIRKGKKIHLDKEFDFLDVK